MKHLHFLITLVFLFSIILSCQQTPDFEKEKAELLAWHKKNMDALIAADEETLFQIMPDGCIELVEGQVNVLNREKDKELLDNMFANTNFTEMPDIAESIIHVSKDGSMAWMINQFKVKYISTDSTGQETPGESTGGELLVFEKKDAQWVLVSYSESYQKPADK